MKQKNLQVICRFCLWGEQDLNLSAETRINAAKCNFVKSDCHDFATDL
tara:strand:- start:58 stop:201 length:144 start_codon:yes stop_codon:yes gene_type:complete